MIESAVTLLPQPDSPTSPSASPRSTWNDTPLTAWTTPGADEELGPQVADVEEARSQFGSSARLTASRATTSRPGRPEGITPHA